MRNRFQSGYIIEVKLVLVVVSNARDYHARNSWAQSELPFARKVSCSHSELSFCQLTVE